VLQADHFHVMRAGIGAFVEIIQVPGRVEHDIHIDRRASYVEGSNGAAAAHRVARIGQPRLAQEVGQRGQRGRAQAADRVLLLRRVIDIDRLSIAVPDQPGIG